MTLEQTLFHLGKDTAYFVASEIADTVSTYAGVKKNGIDAESNEFTRNLMKEKGMTPGLLTSAEHQLTMFGIFFAGSYGLDVLLNVQDNMFNVHHLYSYGIGTLKFLAAVNNTAQALGFPQVGRVICTPAHMFVKLYERVKAL